MIKRQSHFVVIGLNILVVPETKHPLYCYRHVLRLIKVLEMAVDAEEQGWIILDSVSGLSIFRKLHSSVAENGK